MFLDDKPQGEVITKLKLSEAIRKGLAIIKESPSDWKFCALGAAFAGVRGRQMSNDEGCNFIFDKSNKRTSHNIADAIGYPRDLCEKVHRKHRELVPAARIADWLESQGE